eukprot:548358-Rhodomonas_salina.3
MVFAFGELGGHGRGPRGPGHGYRHPSPVEPLRTCLVALVPWVLKPRTDEGLSGTLSVAPLSLFYALGFSRFPGEPLWVAPSEAGWSRHGSEGSLSREEESSGVHARAH